MKCGGGNSFPFKERSGPDRPPGKRVPVADDQLFGEEAREGAVDDVAEHLALGSNIW